MQYANLAKKYRIFAVALIFMIKKGINKVLALVSGLLFSLIMSAQTLPLLPSDPAFNVEVFSNGMKCYVAANPYVKGFADCAVVCKSDQTMLLRKHNLMTADPERVDSTLLAMVRAVAATGCPAEYAIIACGDLSASEVMMKVKYMSLMVNAGPEPDEVVYPEGEQTAVSFREEVDAFNGVSTIVAEWTSPRTPGRMMNTTQKAIYDKSVYELGHISCDRLEMQLKGLGIEVIDMALRHKSSLESTAEEAFELYVKVYTHHASAAADALKETLGVIDAHGAYASELRLAENAYMNYLTKVSADHSNAAYFNRCVSAYLYNAPLISPEGLIDFHRSKNISDGLRESVFASISSALIEMEPGEYHKPEERYIEVSDTLALPVMCPKMMLRSFRKDHMSGGVLWTFMNGFKVVYRKMPTKGKTYYSLAVNGGYGSIKGRGADEGYLSDYLDSCYISGLKSDYFADMLQLAGVTMNAKLNFSNVIISGEAQDGKIDLMMKSLLAVVNERSSRDPLFDKMASGMNDGVLVIVSDMEEYRIRKQMAMYVGGFQTQKSVSRRVNVNSRTVNALHHDDTGQMPGGVSLTASLRMPVTLENCVTADMAAFILEYGLMNELADHDVTVDVSHSLRIYPEGTYNVKVEIRTKDGSDIDAGMLKDIRSALSKVEESDIDPELMTSVRTYVKHDKFKEKELPSYWLHAIALRYLDGKDFTSGYEAKVDAVSAAKVGALILSMEDGFRSSFRKINL